MEAGLSLPEWVVLAVVGERPAHGFAVASLTEPDGELGRIWRVPRGVIYRAIGTLLDDGLVAPVGVQAGRGPQRTIYEATPRGRAAVEEWLATPVEHVRDVRSHLLLKLAFLDRAGRDPTDLLCRQRARLEEIAAAMNDRCSGEPGFDAVLFAWRRAATAAALAFVEDVLQTQTSSP